MEKTKRKRNRKDRMMERKTKGRKTSENEWLKKSKNRTNKQEERPTKKD
jgi:hypothetical protein